MVHEKYGGKQLNMHTTPQTVSAFCRGPRNWKSALPFLHFRCMAMAMAYNTCIAQKATYRSCSGAVHVTDSGRTGYKT